MKVLLVAVGIMALAGATAGLLGIGGALIFNPYLLQLGMDPRVRYTSRFKQPAARECSLRTCFSLLQ